MKRFYDEVAVQEVEAGWQVTLDGRGLKTVKGAPQVVPTLALAEALAAEWRAQGEELRLECFKLRDQADFAIDQIVPDPGEMIEKLLSFAETDTLCYRADPQDALFAKQQDEWEPIVAALESREAITLHRISGVMHRAQPNESIERLRNTLEKFDGFTLAGLFTLSSLAASLCIGLAALEEGSDPEMLWRAASLEEEWQADLWGRDSQAEERRANRREDFLRAAEWIALLRE